MLARNMGVKQSHVCAGPRRALLHVTAVPSGQHHISVSPSLDAPLHTQLLHTQLEWAPTSLLLEHPASVYPCVSFHWPHVCTLGCSTAHVTALLHPSAACIAAVGVWMGSTPAAGSPSTLGTCTLVPQERAGMASYAAAQSSCSTLRWRPLYTAAGCSNRDKWR